MSGSLPCFSHISASRDVDYLGITLPIFLFRSIDPSVLSNLMTLILVGASVHSGAAEAGKIQCRESRLVADSTVSDEAR
jgi:hypothetical protein